MSTRFLALATFAFLVSCSDPAASGKDDSVRDSAVVKIDTARKDSAGAGSAKASAVQRISANDYSLQLPTDMEQATGLNSDAGLQYRSVARDLYVIVLDQFKPELIKILRTNGQYDEKASALQNYRMANIGLMRQNMPQQGPADLRPDTINGLSAEVLAFTATVKNGPEPLYYKIAYLDGKDRMYTVMTWTRAAFAVQNEADMENMVQSFRVEIVR